MLTVLICVQLIFVLTMIGLFFLIAFYHSQINTLLKLKGYNILLKH